MISVKTDSGTVTIYIPEVSEFTGQPLVNIGIKISGGADSAILAYMLALYKKNFRPDIKLHAITCVNHKKPYQGLYAAQVITEVEKLTGVKFENHFSKGIPGDNYGKEQEDFLMSFYEDGVIDCHFMGETINPPVDIPELQTPDRPTIRDVEAPTRVKNSFRPLRMSNKKDIAQLYAHYGITEHLFTLTRSCEHLSTNIEELLTHCGQCWFCLERKWGFGRLV